MAIPRFWVDVDGEGEPTVWTGNPSRPTAILRRCEIAADEDTRDAVMKRLNDTVVSASLGTTWRCVANTCQSERHPYSGWEDRCAQVARHVREVAHDSRWPLTITVHDATGRQFSVDYAEPVLTNR